MAGSVNVHGQMVSVSNQFGAQALQEMSPGRHVSALNSMGSGEISSQASQRITLKDVQRKTLASPKMSKVRHLSPYMNNRGAGDSSPKLGPASGQQFLKYAITKKDPSELTKQLPMLNPPHVSSFPCIGDGGKDSPRLDGVDE